MIYCDLRAQTIDILPLTQLQQEMYASISLGLCDYKEQIHINLKQTPDCDILRQALENVVSSQPALRSVFRQVTSKKPTQIVLKDIILPFYVDCDPPELDVTSEPWNLSVSTARNRLSLLYNHIVMDGWSMAILFKQLFSGYESIYSGETWNIQSSSTMRTLFSIRKNRDTAKNEVFWRDILSNCYPTLLSDNICSIDSSKEESYKCSVPQEITQKLFNKAKELCVTPSVLFYAVWAILLGSFTGSKKVCLGVLLSGRGNKNVSFDTIGMYVQSIPLVTNLEGDFSDICHEISCFLRCPEVNAFEAGEDALISSGFSRRQELFDTLVAVENYPLDATETSWQALKINSYDYYERPSYPFTLQIRMGNTTDLMLTSTRDELFGNLKLVLNCYEGFLQQIANGVTELSELKICNVFNEEGFSIPFSTPSTLDSLIREGCFTGGDKIAISDGDETWTYQELLEQAECCAKGLVSLGVVPGDSVGICMERSARQLIAVYAVILVGGIYVPFSDSIPAIRANDMIVQAGIQRVICHTLPNDWQVEPVLFDDCFKYPEILLPNISKDSSRTAYILFTSGTTGRPKGCMVSHNSLYNRLLWNCIHLGLRPEERQLYKTPITFDVSLIEIFSIFVGRFTLYVLPQGNESRADCLVETIKKNKITYLHFVPSMLHTFLGYLDAFEQEKCLETIRIMVCSGEILPSSLVKNLLQRTICKNMQMYNLYGPTEASVDVSVHSCTVDELLPETPIGLPIWNTGLRVLDLWYRSLPNGICGELYIFGSNLGQGYVNNLEQTAANFLILPDGKRAYRTGDIAYRLLNEELVLIGRRDDQIKYNGVRIEISEIYETMMESGMVKGAATLLYKGNPDRLIAFYVGEKENEQNLRKYLSSRIPSHMLPSDYCKIDSLPKTAHGKLDKNYLLEQFNLHNHLRKEINFQYNENNEIERSVAEIWCQLIETDRKFLPEDNFFAFGGTSLLLIRMQIEIRKRWKVELPAHLIYKSPLLGHICNLIQTAYTGQAIQKATKNSVSILNTAQETIAKFQFLNPSNTAYNMPICFRLLPSVRAQDVLGHISQMIKENHWLRLTVKSTEKGLLADTVEYTQPHWEESHCTSSDILERISSFVRPFSPDKLMIRGAILRCEQEEYVLLDLHHLLCDQAVSQFLVESLLNRMDGNIKPLEVPVFKSEMLLSSGDTSPKIFPATNGKVLDQIKTNHPNRLGQLKRKGFCFSVKENQMVYDACAQYGVSAFLVLFTGFFMFSSRIADSNNLTIGTNTTSDTLQSAAMSLRVLPIQMQFNSSDTFETLLMQLNKAFANALAYMEGFSLGQFDVMFVREESPFNNDRWKKYFHEVSYINTTSKLGLTLFYKEIGKGFTFSFDYDAGLFDSLTIQNFVESYRFLLFEGLTHPKQSISEFQTMPQEQQISHTSCRGLSTPLPNQTIQTIFLDCCKKNPNAIAIYDKENWSYRKLLTLASKIAASLIEREDIGNLIGVLLPPSAEYLVTVFGILLAGKAFLPLDIQNPTQRNAAILKDSEVILCVSNQGIKFHTICCLTVEELSSHTLPVQCQGNMNDNVYCIYTSGSTGKPKGCVISQTNALNYLQWANSFYLNNKKGCFAFFTSPASDMTITSTLLPIMFGHSVVIYPQSARSILDASNDARVTVLKATPSHLNLIREKRMSSIQTIIVGGEQLTSALAANLSSLWKSPPDIYNEYGPTESTVGCMIYKYNPKDPWAAVPIGTAIDNMQISILDSKERPCIPGVSGELVLQGRSVIAGYLNQSTNTEERFAQLLDGTWQYKTGDFAHMCADGRIIYESRRDNQFQLSGYRVELGEIEQVAKETGGIEEACAIIHENQEGNSRLILYCVTNSTEYRDEVQLRKILFQKVPRYMIPGQIVFLEHLPLTSSGKIDRNILIKNTVIEGMPSDNTVRFLSTCWRKILGNSNFTLNDGFMEAGGNSLSIVALQQEISVQYPEITVENLFCYPSINALAKYLENNGQKQNIVNEAYRGEIVITGVAFSLCGAADLLSLRNVFSSQYSQIGYPNSRRRKDTKTALLNMGMQDKLYRFGMAAYLSDIDLFDNDYFRIGKDEANAMDPAHKLLLTIADRAFTDANFGHDFNGKNSAVVFGAPENIGYQDYVTRCYPNLSRAAMLNRVGSSIVGRIQHFYNLTGPAYLIDSACSSGLSALYNACAMIRAGDCDSALVGGVNLLNPLDISGEQKPEILSHRHHANTFAAIADGTARGEGCICLVLEKKEDVERANRTFYAEVIGGATNNDGFSASVTAPNGSAQVHLIRSAMKNAAIKPSDFGLIETHGTATQLGDSVELKALGDVFSERIGRGKCALSAAKTVYGHLDSVSGLLGVIKTILSLYYRELYHFIGVDIPTERFDFIESHFYMPDQVIPFPKNCSDDHICGISSFGLSGTNVHMILRQGNRTSEEKVKVQQHQKLKRCWLPDEPEHRFVGDKVQGKTQIQTRQTCEEIDRELSEKVAQLNKVNEVSYNMPFYEMGFDSVSIVQLRIFIQSNYGFELPVSPQDTISSIADEVFRKSEKNPSESKKRQHKNKVITSVLNTMFYENWEDYQFRVLVSDFARDYVKKTRLSRERMLDEKLEWANGRFITGQTKGLDELSYPIIASRGMGSEMWDIDGNYYIDYAMGFGVHFFGYNHPKIESAVVKEMQNGPVLGALMNTPFQVAEKISNLTGIERVSFCSSGTEAMMNLLRIARAVTSRNCVVMFEGSFHGSFDPLFVMKNELDDSFHPLPRSMGTPISYMDDIVMLPYGDDVALEYIRNHGSELAAVLVEPVQSRNPALRPAKFLHTLRKITQENGILLIFDEVITGFRSGTAGAQGYYGVQADLVAYGKIIGGGYPIGVFGGMARYMDLLDHRGSLRPTGAGHTLVGNGGTFHAHPTSMAAASKVLDIFEKDGESLCAEANAKTEHLAIRLNEFLLREKTGIQIEHFCSQFIFTGGEARALRLLQYLLIYNGIYVWEGGTCFVSTEHTWDQIHTFVDTVKRCVEKMRQMLSQVSSFSTRLVKGLSQRDYSRIEQFVSKYDLDEIESIDAKAAALLANNVAQRNQGGDVSIIRINIKRKIEMANVQLCMNRIINSSRQLRSALSWRRLERPIQMVFRKAHCEVNALQTNQADLELLISHTIEKRQRSGFQIEHAPLVGVDIFNVSNGETEFLLSFYNGWIDGWSADLLLRHLLSLLNNEQTDLVEVDWQNFKQWEKKQTPQAKSYWKDALSHFSPRPQYNLVEGTWQEYTLQIEEKLAHIIKKFASKHRISEASVYLCVMARSMGQSWIMTTISGRNAPVPGLWNTIGNFASLAPIHIPQLDHVDQAITVNTSVEILSQLPTCDLETIQQYAGFDLGALDALVQAHTLVILNQVEDRHYNTDASIREDRSYIRVPCRYYITPGEKLLITYHTGYISCENVAKIVQCFVEQIEEYAVEETL
ncbi:MAG: aminotransferase class III-fold pyridoxal phosphate-dependent enzyme [Christensenellaceae bacterium]|jgi:amino acid adenylation domain-containing protein|nr:aminotransferase class III-fold pyridoxal phosphate-dependent enzyme [Christensenellaceae bacterium]